MDIQIAPPYKQHSYWMQQAVSLAQLAGEAGEVPVGAIVVDGNNNAISAAQNYRERHHDPTAHAEVIALRLAGQYLHSWHLNNCTLYVTLEPCPMCAGAIIQARIKLLVYGADDPKSGAVRTVCNIPDSDCSYHRLEVLGGILESNCRQQLQSWFAQKRKCR
ncbi:tRNA adenosine(34) deaminase TadA [Chlorogloea sp. CCALA 695]|uniref:tRNA adenosine(34) deaminase TadA n=1 Tax=Chlorogloea sp. CCALA 695 TaxID=2107693 RepID=UPI0021013992|nr:tRNA adenosine(34) deaminase TadA [Chlorogloea sp. CCALA 695]